MNDDIGYIGLGEMVMAIGGSMRISGQALRCCI